MLKIVYNSTIFNIEHNRSLRLYIIVYFFKILYVKYYILKILYAEISFNRLIGDLVN